MLNICRAFHERREFKLQAIISTPTDKLRDLINYVDLILVAMHSDKSKRSSLDVYAEKKKEDNYLENQRQLLEEGKEEKSS